MITEGLQAGVLFSNTALLIGIFFRMGAMGAHLDGLKRRVERIEEQEKTNT